MPRKPRTVKYAMDDIVSYCPGDAIGSPSSMSRQRALNLMKQDSAYLDDVNRVMDPPYRIYPHIGGFCDRCRPKS